jgi:hypothetical protein
MRTWPLIAACFSVANCGSDHLNARTVRPQAFNSSVEKNAAESTEFPSLSRDLALGTSAREEKAKIEAVGVIHKIFDDLVYQPLKVRMADGSFKFRYVIRASGWGFERSEFNDWDLRPGRDVVIKAQGSIVESIITAERVERVVAVVKSVGETITYRDPKNPKMVVRYRRISFTDAASPFTDRNTTPSEQFTTIPRSRAFTLTSIIESTDEQNPRTEQGLSLVYPGAVLYLEVMESQKIRKLSDLAIFVFSIDAPQVSPRFDYAPVRSINALNSRADKRIRFSFRSAADSKHLTVIDGDVVKAGPASDFAMGYEHVYQKPLSAADFGKEQRLFVISRSASGRINGLGFVDYKLNVKLEN